MKFEIHEMKVRTPEFGEVSGFKWFVTAKDKGTVAQGPKTYMSEEEARSDIAKARKAFGGYKFAKVETHPLPEDKVTDEVQTNFEPSLA